MKRVGILTFHRSINYGAFLQSYSLSKKIKEVTGCEVEIIDYENKMKHLQYLKAIIYSTDISFCGPYRNMKRYLAFKKSLPRLPLSPDPIITNSVNILHEKIDDRYDVIITGSDAVFNFNALKLPNPYWLEGFDNVIKMSYAASAHGMDFEKISEESCEKISRLLSKFSYIGVRDEETMKMIQKSNKNLSIHRNCDPTVLLDLDDYKTDIDKILYKKYKINSKDKLIGLMVYDRELGKKIKEKYGNEYKIVSIYRNNPYSDYYLYDLDPFEWSHVFSKFKILFTKYFHGTLLCLKNTTPVISIDYSNNVEKYNTKLKDLMVRLGLSSSYFKKIKGSDFNYNNIFDTADSYLHEPEYIKKKIIDGLNEEIKYSNSFIDAITSIK